MYGIKRRNKDEWFQGFGPNGNPAFGPKETAQRDSLQLASMQAMLLNRFDESVQRRVKRI